MNFDDERTNNKRVDIINRIRNLKADIARSNYENAHSGYVIPMKIGRKHIKKQPQTRRKSQIVITKNAKYQMQRANVNCDESKYIDRYFTKAEYHTERIMTMRVKTK